MLVTGFVHRTLDHVTEYSIDHIYIEVKLLGLNKVDYTNGLSIRKAFD